MEIEKRFVAKVGDYHVVETRFVKAKGETAVIYTIHNPAGHSIGKRFRNSKEPIELLVDMKQAKDAVRN